MLIFAIFLVILLCFAFVLIWGAPYLPTHTKQAELALDLLELKKGQTLYELGCGDGKVLRMAAKRGVKSVGYELNPLLCVVAILTTIKYRGIITVKFGSFWMADLSAADGVYTFLLDKFMLRLDKKLEKELRPGVKLASYVFKIPDKKPRKVQGGVNLYRY